MSTIAAWIVCFCVDRFGHMVICACSRIEARMRMRAYMIWMDPQYQIQFYFSLSKISQIEQAIELYATKWPSSYAITHMCMCVCESMIYHPTNSFVSTRNGNKNAILVVYYKQ